MSFAFLHKHHRKYLRWCKECKEQEEKEKLKRAQELKAKDHEEKLSEQVINKIKKLKQ